MGVRRMGISSSKGGRCQQRGSRGEAAEVWAVCTKVELTWCEPSACWLEKKKTKNLLPPGSPCSAQGVQRGAECCHWHANPSHPSWEPT